MFEKFKTDEDAKMSVSTGSIIGLSIAALFFAAIGVTALNTTINANTATWSATNVALYGIIVLAIIAAFVYHFLPSEWRK